MSPRTRNWIIGAVVAAVLIAVVGPFVYINLINDPAPELGFDDLDSSPAGDDSSDSGGTGGSTDPTDPTGAADGADGAGTGAGGGGATGGSGSQAGGDSGSIGGEYVVGGGRVQYRVPETLFGQRTEGVGGTDAVTGTLVLEGTTVTQVALEVDMTTVRSDRSQRDGQFHGRIMRTAEFPTATFVLTAPIELGSLPPDGEAVTVQATGDLTIRGVTRSVTFEISGRLNGGAIEVDADIPVDFDAFGIPDASGGPASVGRTATLEVLLSFSPAT